jgi:hypothetical protein
MNIEQHLRQLHEIKPDPAYARDSRVRLIMAMADLQQPKITLRVLLMGMLRSGSAMAAVGLLLFFAVGGSVWSLVVGPATKLARWDSKTLLAEAQAIDTQIHLADLQYSDPGYERQRLISPSANLNSIAIITSPEDSDLVISVPSEETASSTVVVATSEDANSTSTTPVILDGSEAATSTPVIEEDPAVSVEEALDILSH